MNPIAACYVERGLTHFARNEFLHAIAAFDVALQIDPYEPYARWNRATALLSSGDYQRGFPEHDVAWRLFHWRGFGPVKDDIDRIAHLPVWHGNIRNDIHLLVYHELGFGDSIMAMRWLPELKRRCEGVTLVIDPTLARLARSFDVEVTTKVPDDLDRFDYRLPFFGVMSALGETGETIPSEPYIKPHFHFTKWMREEVKEVVGNKIGIAWSGRTQTMFTANHFLSLLDTGNAKLFALQPGEAPDHVEPLPSHFDFADLADRMACMDHIVSVDTAAIHLAGAMGHPSAHLLLPFVSDWRWWHTERWYPRLKTYRQPTPDDWSAPFAQLNAAILERGTPPGSVANELTGFL